MPDQKDLRDKVVARAEVWIRPDGCLALRVRGTGDPELDNMLKNLVSSGPVTNRLFVSEIEDLLTSWSPRRPNKYLV